MCVRTYVSYSGMRKKYWLSFVFCRFLTYFVLLPFRQRGVTSIVDTRSFFFSWFSDFFLLAVPFVRRLLLAFFFFVIFFLFGPSLLRLTENRHDGTRSGTISPVLFL